MFNLKFFSYEKESTLFNYQYSIVLLWSNAFSQTQQNYWVLSPNVIDFTGTPSSSSLPTPASTTPYVTANGAFDENGNILFFVRNDSVYDADGDFAGRFNDYDWTGSNDFCSQIMDEIAIVPVPGTCRDFYVIYYKYHFISGAGLLYSKVSVSTSGTVTIPVNSSFLYFFFSNHNTFAVSQYESTINGRYLYALGYPDLKKYNITSSGISFNTNVYTNVPDYNAYELELNHQGTFLAWGDYGSNKIYEVSSSGGSITTYTISGLSFGNIMGIEYTPDGDYIYAIGNGMSGSGIYRVTKNGPSVTFLSGSSEYNNTHLELGRDGYIYGASSSSSPAGKLGIIDISSNTISASPLSNVVYATANAGPSNGGIYRLPYQVDGENYYSFRGVDLPAFSSVTINSEASTSPWNSFYNCNTINLAVTASGSQGRIILTKVDVNKDPIGGGSAFSATTSWDDIADLNDDLRTFPGTSDHLLTNNGYYKLEIQIKNSCDVIVSETWWLEINASPTPSSISLTLNDYTLGGPPASPAHSAPGLNIGAYSGSFNISTSTGDITYYTVEIEEVTSGGAYIQTILPTQNIPVSDFSTVTAKNFNIYNIPAIPAESWSGGAGYFGQRGLNRYFKVIVAVGNDCGSSSDYSFINMNCACKMGSFAYNDASPTPELAYPNPFDREVIVSVPTGEPVTVSIHNTMGNAVLKKQFDGMETLYGNVRLETADLPKGAYIFMVEHNGEIATTGTIIK